MPIVGPYDVDSLGKLNEWIEICGVPELIATDVVDCSTHDFMNLAIGFGFRFSPDDRSASNDGYRRLAQTCANALYVRLVESIERDAGARIEWRVRPEFRESTFSYIETIDGSEIDWERMEEDPDDDDYRRTMTREVFTTDRCGQIYARCTLVTKKA